MKRICTELRDCLLWPAGKVSVIAIALLFLSLVANSAPFVTPSMIYRNGLTDEQYELLWSQGKRPQIDTATARDLVLRASRYQNVTNWLGIIGKTNDFARLVLPTMATNEMLTATNKTLTARCDALLDSLTETYTAYTNQVTLTEKAQAKIDGEIEDLQEKIEKYEEYKTKYPLLKTVWATLIADAENRIKILQAINADK